jgi:8-oxo-dGTP diphosphatase
MADNGPGSRRHTLAGDVHLLLVNPAGEVLFGKRQETGCENGAWQLPSGHLQAGESVAAALIREARKQTGVVIDEQDVEFAHVMHNSSGGGRMIFFFVLRNWAGEPGNLKPGKCRQLE